MAVLAFAQHIHTAQVPRLIQNAQVLWHDPALFQSCFAAGGHSAPSASAKPCTFNTPLFPLTPPSPAALRDALKLSGTARPPVLALAPYETLVCCCTLCRLWYCCHASCKSGGITVTTCFVVRRLLQVHDVPVAGADRVLPPAISRLEHQHLVKRICDQIVTRLCELCEFVTRLCPMMLQLVGMTLLVMTWPRKCCRRLLSGP